MCRKCKKAIITAQCVNETRCSNKTNTHTYTEKLIKWIHLIFANLPITHRQMQMTQNFEWHDGCEGKNESATHTIPYMCMTYREREAAAEMAVNKYIFRLSLRATTGQLSCYSKLDDFEWHSHINITGDSLWAHWKIWFGEKKSRNWFNFT